MIDTAARGRAGSLTQVRRPRRRAMIPSSNVRAIISSNSVRHRLEEQHDSAEQG